MTSLSVARLLTELRPNNGNVLQSSIIEALLYIANGIDNRPALCEAMMNEEGVVFDDGACNRIISGLRCRTYYRDGKYVNPSFTRPLIEVRRHPHIRNAYQMRPSLIGREILVKHLGEDACPGRLKSDEEW